jgi:2-C-methyl-D-erythritol 4-phosphate cytidylyltransferase/2-C-methyl-D-erythritol 2,4-cyclodiphosphate synthase
MLCGLAVPHERGLLGHSDADVALHALTDALLGAIGDGDIGAHFPPSDPQWKGAASARFLEDAVARVTARGGRIVHLDTTIVCEAPRVGPHREAMRKRLAEIAGVEIDRVSVKATTSEKLGFTGRRDGDRGAAASGMIGISEAAVSPGCGECDAASSAAATPQGAHATSVRAKSSPTQSSRQPCSLATS